MFTVSTSSNTVKHRVAVRGVRLVALLLICVGTSMALAGLLDGYLFGVAAAVVSCVVCSALFATSKVKNANRIALVVSLVLGAAVLVLGMASVVRCSLHLLNGVIQSWNLQVDAYVPLYSVSDLLVLDVLLGGALAGVLLGLLVYWLDRMRLGMLVALFAGVVMVCHLLTPNPGPLPAVLLVAGWMGVWSAAAPSQTKRAWTTLAAMLLACACTLVLVLPVAGVQQQSPVAGVKAAVKQVVDQVRYGQDSLPQGNLTQAYDMQASAQDDSAASTPRLSVTFDSADQVRAEYLRGYTGATLTSNQWVQLDRSDYAGEWNGLFSWASSHGFDPLLQNALYDHLDNAANGLEEPTLRLQISNVGAYRKYAYVPYGTGDVQGDGSQTLLDRYRQASGLTGSSNYQAQVVTDLAQTEIIQPSDWVYSADANAGDQTGDYLLVERVYRSFVKEKYLTVDEESAAFVDEHFFGTNWTDDDANNLYSLVTRVRTILESDCSVATTPTQVPANQQFVTWFMTDAKRGNSAYFASAAVLAFRQAGVPARYAEGYFLTGQEAANMQANNQTQRTLTQADAHAWVEIYVDGIGWMPVEVTPGYYEPVYTADQVIEVPREVAGNGSDDSALGAVNQDGTQLDDQQQDQATLAQIAGTVVLALFGLVLLALLVLELQRFVRVMRRRGLCLQGLDEPTDGFVRWLYAYVSGLMGQAGIVLDTEKPLDALDQQAVAAAGLLPSQAQRVLSLFQSYLFGGKQVQRADVRMLLLFANDLEQANKQGATFVQVLRHRYVDAYGGQLGLALDKADTGAE